MARDRFRPGCPCARLQIRRFSGVARNCTGSGAIRRRGHGLQRELGGVDQPAAVVPDVDDQAVLRQGFGQPDEFVAERHPVLHREGEDAQVTECPGRRGHRPGPEHPGHGGRQIGVADSGRSPQLGRRGSLFRSDHIGDEQQLVRPALLVGVQVDAHRCGRGRQLRSGRSSAAGCPPPATLPELASHAVETDIADGDPILDRRQLDDQGTDGQGLEASGQVGRLVAPGEQSAVDRHRGGDRRAVPVGDLTPGSTWSADQFVAIRVIR